MTVNEIIKAFERCDQLYSVCRGCPLYNKDHCRDQLKRAIINKLNRQQDEIERLNHIRAELSREVDHLREVAKMVRDETVVLFAERLKEAARTEYDSDGWVIGSCVDVRDIDAILKQNTEGKQDAVQDTRAGAE